MASLVEKISEWQIASVPGVYDDYGSGSGEETIRGLRPLPAANDSWLLYPDRITLLSLEECKELVWQVWHDYRAGSPMPTVYAPAYGTDNQVNASGGRRWITLPDWARLTPIVLHEVAHSLVPRSGHGPKWVALYIDLLVRYHTPCRGMRRKLRASARAAKIMTASQRRRASV